MAGKKQNNEGVVSATPSYKVKCQFCFTEDKSVIFKEGDLLTDASEDQIKRALEKGFIEAGE